MYKKIIILLSVCLINGSCGNCNEKIAFLENKNARLQHKIENLRKDKGRAVSMAEAAQVRAVELTVAFNSLVSQIENITFSQIGLVEVLSSEIVLERNDLERATSQLSEISEALEAAKSDKNSLQQRLEEELRRNGANRNEVVQLRKRVRVATTLLLEKERQIERARDRLEALVARNQKLENENVNLRANLTVSDISRREAESKNQELTRTLSELEEEVGTAYVLVATKRQLKYLNWNNIIDRQKRNLFVARNVKGEFFKEVPADAMKVPLGSSLEDPEVVSVHESLPSLYRLTEKRGILQIEISDPKRFWAISRYLIVRVDRLD